MFKKILIPIVVVVLSSAGCDPEKALDKYFADKGLNRLSYVRDDVAPGALVLSGPWGTVYADNVSDYGADVSLTISSTNAMTEYQAALSKSETDRAVTAGLAMKFVQAILPIGGNVALNLTSDVEIEMTEARVSRLKIPAIQKILNSKEAGEFNRFVEEFLGVSKDHRAYLVFESFRAKSLKMKAVGGKEITSSIDVDSAISVLGEAGAAFEYRRTSTSQLDINGDKWYGFAVRAGQLVPHPEGGVRFLPGNFKFTDRLAAGTDEEAFTQSMKEEFAPVTIGSWLSVPSAVRNIRD